MWKIAWLCPLVLTLQGLSLWFSHIVSIPTILEASLLPLTLGHWAKGGKRGFSILSSMASFS